ETPKWDRCNACDICAPQLDWMSADREPDAKRVSAMPIARSKVSAQPDSELLQHMREWRRGFARQRGVPAFMILNDASLAALCRKEPDSLAGLLEVTGIGEKKAQSFGKEILTELRN